MTVYLRLTITDTLRVLVDDGHAFNPLAKVTRTFWYRLPRDWVRGGLLKPNRRAYLIDLLYGAGWQDGNDDGSRYVILQVQQHVLTDEEARARPWLSERAAFYAWRDDDVLEEIIPAHL